MGNKRSELASRYRRFLSDSDSLFSAQRLLSYCFVAMYVFVHGLQYVANPSLRALFCANSSLAFTCPHRWQNFSCLGVRIGGFIGLISVNRLHLHERLLVVDDDQTDDGDAQQRTDADDAANYPSAHQAQRWQVSLDGAQPGFVVGN